MLKVSVYDSNFGFTLEELESALKKKKGETVTEMVTDWSKYPYKEKKKKVTKWHWLGEDKILAELIKRIDPYIRTWANSKNLKYKSNDDLYEYLKDNVMDRLIKFDPKKGTLKTWLYKVLENITLDFIRRVDSDYYGKKVEQPIEDIMPDTESLDVRELFPSVDNVEEDVRLKRVIEKSMELLPTDYDIPPRKGKSGPGHSINLRLVLEKMIEGWSIHEIAKMDDININEGLLNRVIQRAIRPVVKKVLEEM